MNRMAGYVSLARRHCWMVGGVLLLAAMSTLFEGVAIVSLIPLLELAIGGGGNVSAATALAEKLADGLSVDLSIPLVLVVFVSLGVLSAVIKYALSIVQVRLGNRVEKECQLQLYTSIISTSWPVVSEAKSGELLKGVLGDPQQIRAGFLGLLTATTSLLESLIYMVLALVLSFKLTLLVGIFAIVTLVSRDSRSSRA